MDNKTVAAEIMQDFEALLGEMYINTAFKVELKEGLEKIIENRLSSTRVLYDPEKLLKDMSADTTFGWVEDEPHHRLCACETCLVKAANEKV